MPLIVVVLAGVAAHADEPLLKGGVSRMDVGIAMDAVLVEHHETWGVQGGQGTIERELPTGALLVAASLGACGGTIAARPVDARKAVPGDLGPGSIGFPLPACAIGGALELAWSYVMQAVWRDGHFHLDIPSADKIAIEIEGGGPIWKMMSSTHTPAPRYRGETAANVAIVATAPGLDAPTRFRFAWRLSGLDEHGFGGLTWATADGEVGRVFAALPAAAVNGREPIALSVLLDRRLGPAALARIDTWFRTMIAGAGPEDRFNFTVHDGTAPFRKPFGTNHRARWSAEAVGLEQARSFDVKGWFAQSMAVSTGLSWGAAVLMAKAETTPIRWRRMVVAFGDTGPLDAATVDVVSAGPHPARLMVIGPIAHGAARVETEAIERLVWDSDWDRAGAPKPGRWPANSVRPDVVRLVCGKQKETRSLGDLWPDRPTWLRHWAPRGMGAALAKSARCATETVFIEGEVGDAWLQREVQLTVLEPETLVFRAAAALARVMAVGRTPSLAPELSKHRGLAVGSQVLAWPAGGLQPPLTAGAGPVKVPKGLKPLAVVVSDSPGLENAELFAATAPARTRPVAGTRRAFKVKTIASRVGGRSGTQLRDRLERHRDALELALGEALPGGSRRMRRIDITLVVDVAGGVKRVDYQPSLDASSGLEQLTGLLKRLAFDPLSGSDGGDTLFAIHLDLR